MRAEDLLRNNARPDDPKEVLRSGPQEDPPNSPVRAKPSHGEEGESETEKEAMTTNNESPGCGRHSGSRLNPRLRKCE
jgi:hypothetical protein